MIQTVETYTHELLRQAYLASKTGGKRATLFHNRNGVETACHGYHLSSGHLSLIKPDMTYILVEEEDTVTYDDGN